MGTRASSPLDRRHRDTRAGRIPVLVAYAVGLARARVVTRGWRPAKTPDPGPGQRRQALAWNGWAAPTPRARRVTATRDASRTAWRCRAHCQGQVGHARTRAPALATDGQAPEVYPPERQLSRRPRCWSPAPAWR